MQSLAYLELQDEKMDLLGFQFRNHNNNAPDNKGWNG